ncbi:uncharacterized protein EI97DRAFT_436778 [Westerdykella ornata]|uniref:Uncharacterized protein n=1 Tax=Westerdykella ornata TaxID=318751 RepID=A0A6A6J815_WESOR|nr:uncharacterized protein EI97DRAFT_436778 [Westerdykella ornata]KAF2272701.1 hypothetical protein EI97DRAFT_436778 [Westerdykella ornata]
MLAVRLLSALLLTATGGLSQASSTNLRPRNITGLVYHLYAWTGSYYNGTTTIRIQPQDLFPDTECDTFAKEVEVSYESSVLAIIESDPSVPDNNEVTFALKYWDKSLNVVPEDLVYSNGPVNDITNIASVKTDGVRPEVHWRLNTSHLSATSYSFAGYRNESISNPPIRLNYSQCSTPDLAQYNGFLLQPGGYGDVEALNVTSYPTVSGRFDNQSASLEIKGVLDAKIPGSDICGPVTISFLGQLDGNRSDELLSSSGDKPAWNPTLGYSKTVFQSSGAPSPEWRNGVSSWLYVAGALACALWLL